MSTATGSRVKSAVPHNVLHRQSYFVLWCTHEIKFLRLQGSRRDCGINFWPDLYTALCVELIFTKVFGGQFVFTSSRVFLLPTTLMWSGRWSSSYWQSNGVCSSYVCIQGQWISNVAKYCSCRSHQFQESLSWCWRTLQFAEYLFGQVKLFCTWVLARVMRCQVYTAMVPAIAPEILFLAVATLDPSKILSSCSSI